MAVTFMQRRASGIWEFRKRLPESLAGKPAPEHVRQAFPDLVNATTGHFKRELVRSLEEHDKGKALKANMQLASETLERIEAAQRLMSEDPARASFPPAPTLRFTPGDLQAIEAEARAGVLRQDDGAREQDYRATEQGLSDRAGLGLLADATAGGPFGLKEGGLEGRGIEIAMMLDDFSSAHARRDTSVVRSEVKDLLRSRGVAFDPNLWEHQAAGLAVLRGTLAGYRALAGRQAGEDIPTPEQQPAARRPAPQPAPEASRGPTLSAAYAAWREGGKASGARKPNPRSVIEADTAVRRFTEFHGDMALGEVTKDHARRFRTALASLPKGLPAALARLPLPEILKRDLSAYKPRDAATVNKQLKMLGAIFSHAEREGLLEEVPSYRNPFGETVQLVVNKAEKERREAFTPDDLKRFFGSPVFSRGERPAAGGGEAAFWFPIVGLLSGMRLDEIAGLRMADLREDEAAGSWLFDIAPRSGRTVKTASSVRKVPVHPALLRVGLLRYRGAALAAGVRPDAPLWPDVKAPEGRPISAAWSKWFGRYLRTAGGIEDRRKVFHSFRHTFKQAARDARISEEVHDALTGHASASVGRGYGGFGIRTLAEAMATIEAPEVVSGLVWAEGDRPRSQAARVRPGVNLRSTRGGRTQAD